MTTEVLGAPVKRVEDARFITGSQSGSVMSVTSTSPGASSNSMRLAWPATASSMALSRISAARWCIACSSVPPIYMPGRRRTGSSPSRTSMSLAV